ncbi:chaperonin GroEL [Paenibacillus hamazuiensis]|uniref:chaperonin GroEL n=1 Tax=Paenibacillus hamazuiensis TaxID=2936508 RepID=UPI00200DC2B0|nr:chaperonin GroEL [Paenibacillus hamazuiensis]
MAKLFLLHEEARAALERGVDKLAAIVKSTLGPKGRNVIIDRPFSTPLVSNDGVFIAGEIELEDPFENMGAMLVKEVANHTNNSAGDGTTTATVLAQAMVKEGLKSVRNGANPIFLKKGMELAVKEVVHHLKESAVSVDNNKFIAKVASLAAKDEEIGEFIADAIEKVGKDGIINVIESKLPFTTLEFMEGMQFERGYISHKMVTDPETMEAVLHHPYILIADQKITSVQQISPIIDQLTHKDRPLLLIAEEIESQVLGSLVNQISNKLKIVAVRTPEFGYNRKLVLEDIAILTGAQIVSVETGITLEHITVKDLGSAQQVRVTKDNTSITNGHGDKNEIKGRRNQIQKQFEDTTQEWEKEKLQQRLSNMSSGIAIILVGGATNVERREKLLRVEDALHATQAALEEGVVAGGGTALLQASSALEKWLQPLQGDEKIGAQLVLNVLPTPLQTIAANCGFDGNSIADKVKALPKGHGFNVLTEQYFDMIANGIMDPVKVTCSALENAASIAALIITTESLITNKPDPLIDPASGPARGGGAELLE